MHRCPNRACPSRGLETLNNWVQAAADIEGVGEQFVRRLWAEGSLRSMPDLYRLTKEQLLELDGYAEISARERDRRDRARRRRSRSRACSSGSTSRDIGWVIAQQPRAALRHGRPAARREPGGDPGGRGHRPRPRRGDRRVVRGRAEPRARRGATRARAALRAQRGRAADGGPADRQAVRDHRHARVADARAGEGGARGARREGLRQRLEEDDRRRRRREPGSKVAKAQKAGVPLLTEATCASCSRGLALRRGERRRRSDPAPLRGPPRRDGEPFCTTTNA